jgi:hypothetical protein
MTAGKTNKAQKLIGLLIAGSLLSLVVGCGDNAKFNILDGTGPEPVLPDADTPTITTVNIAPAIGWPATSKHSRYRCRSIRQWLGSPTLALCAT